MKYCQACLSTDTRPNALFDAEGVCLPCRFAKSSEGISYETRFLELEQIVRKLTRTTRNRRWQCIVGVSGGKDSTRQALWVRNQLEINPLLVSVAYPPRQLSQVGASNLTNLTELGFDLLMLGPAPRQSRNLVRESFLRFGNWAKPTEMALFAGVPRVAIEKRIPLILWGENNALQVGETGTLGTSMWDGNNLREMNTLQGGDLGWFVEALGSLDLLRSYQFPTKEEFDAARIRTIFLGPAWEDWSYEQNSLIGLVNGFAPRTLDGPDTDDPLRTSSVDDHFMTVNHLVKYYKFGFGRATDIASALIRRNIISRDEGIAIVQRYDGQCPDEDIEAFARYIGVELADFWATVRRFADPRLFVLTGERPRPLFEVGARAGSRA